MKVYEKIALITIISSLTYSQIKIPFILNLSIFLLVFLYVYIVDKSKYFLLFFLSLGLFYPVFNKFEDLQLNKIYDLRVNVIEGRGEIAGTKYKNINKKYYISDNILKNLEGQYVLRIRIEELNEYYNNYYVKGEVLRVEDTLSNKFINNIKKQIEKTNYNIDLEAFAFGVVLADRSKISSAVMNLFKTTGSAHLLAISGLHIGLVTGIFIFIFSFLPISYKFRYILSLIILSFYVYILAYSPSIQRAYIMAFIFLLSKIFLDKSDNKKSLAIALIISLNLNYYLIHNIAFQMSYLALFAILYVFRKSKNPYLDLLSFSFFIQVCLSPIFIYYFYNLPILAFISNIFAVFIGSILIMLIYINVFLAYINLSFLLRYLLEFIYDVLIVFLNFVENINYMSIDLNRQVPNFIFILLIIGILLIPKFQNFKKYYILGIISLMFLIYPIFPYRIIENNEYVYFPKYKTIVLKEFVPKDDLTKLNKKYNFKNIISKENMEGDNAEVYLITKDKSLLIDKVEVYIDKNKINYRLLF